MNSDENALADLIVDRIKRAPRRKLPEGVADFGAFRNRKVTTQKPDSLLDELMREAVSDIQELRRQQDLEEYVLAEGRRRAVELAHEAAERRARQLQQVRYSPAVEKEIQLLARVAGHRFSAEGRSDYTPAECRAVAIAELLQRAAESAAKRPSKKK